LEEKLLKRRADLGKRFDNVPPQQQLQVYQEIQPQIEAARKETTEALKQVEKILTSDQWKQVPERIRNPFQNIPNPGRAEVAAAAAGQLKANGRQLSVPTEGPVPLRAAPALRISRLYTNA
jgi:hypothetical protein